MQENTIQENTQLPLLRCHLSTQRQCSTKKLYLVSNHKQKYGYGSFLELHQEYFNQVTSVFPAASSRESRKELNRVVACICREYSSGSCYEAVGVMQCLVLDVFEDVKEGGGFLCNPPQHDT